MPKPSPKIVQSRHILALMGVPLWAKRQTSQNLMTLPIPTDRLNANPRLEHLFSDGQSDQSFVASDDVSPINDDLSLLTDDKNIHNDDKKNDNKKFDRQAFLVSHDLGETNQQGTAKRMTDGHDELTSPPEWTPDTNQTSPLMSADHQLEIRFSLQGVRFGRWVLIVDMFAMNRDEASLWQSLKTALNHQSVQHSITAFYREIHYPLVKNEFRLDTGLNPAQHTFDGFVMGLSVGGGASQEVRVAFLTDIPVGVVTHTLVELPMISQMMVDASLKKHLWQQVLGEY